jgi:soluble lytic murein transglycosylase-like protein
MGRMNHILAGLLLTLFAAGPTHANQTERWAGHIAEASFRFGIPEAWIRRVMTAESGGRTTLNGRPIESHAGAMGLMQLMPGTWRAMRAAEGLGPDPHSPRDNILAGTAYLRLMYNRFGYPGLFAAYNAGPGAYAAYLAGARRLPAETIAYVAQVARPGRVRRETVRAAPALAPIRAGQVEVRPGVPAESVFAIRAERDRAVGIAAGMPPQPARAGASLFVSLRTDRP